MDICSDHRHTEICYAGKVCPACELADENEQLEDEVVSLRDEADELERRLESYQEHDD